MPTPNFFLIGAPKCGTTSLSQWLAQHQDVFMCSPKEPYYFCTDLVVGHRAASSWLEYTKLFEGAGLAHAVGEASTSYLRSRTAVPAILKKVPDAKFIVCLRNPVEMVASFHGQMVRSLREDEWDLAKALALEPLRQHGERLPPNCYEPADLVYSNVCALGSQLERLYQIVDPGRVHVVFMDDLSSDPHRVWVCLQEFLGVSEDGRREFGAENVRAIPRFVKMRSGLRSLQRVKDRFITRRSLGIGATLGRVLESVPKSNNLALPVALRAELVVRFKGEIDRIEQLTRRDLAAWRKV